MTSIPSRPGHERKLQARGRLAAAAATLLLTSMSTGCATQESRNSGGQRDAFDDACLERQYVSLQRALVADSFELRQQRDRLQLRWPGDLAFESGSADVATGADAMLATLTDALRECDETVVRIIGHTDGTGSNRTNELLSARRAERVAAALVTRGIDAARLTTAGAGEDRPVATNTTPAGRALNRRVEIEITPPG